MPTAPARPCHHPGCPHRRPCPDHGRRRRRRTPDRRTESAHARGYDGRWRKIRARVLEAEPYCRHCADAGRMRAAEEVDHVVRRRVALETLGPGACDDPGRLEWVETAIGWCWRWIGGNLQPLCKSCHSRKTGREVGE